jgi:hypothetical protein
VATTSTLGATFNLGFAAAASGFLLAAAGFASLKAVCARKVMISF